MKGKTIVITGGNDGIGYQTALELARQGANILIVCRNEQKAKAAVEKIKTAASNSNIQYVLADLASQKSIRKAAEEIRKRVEKIDVLVNNAGGVFSDFELTVDGFEKTIALNHFAYFLLTGLLLDLVKKSDYARIINLASDSHYKGTIDVASFTENKNYSLFKGYRQSKLANILFTFELAERMKHTHVTVNCLHPGTVRTSIANKSGKLISVAWSLVTLFSKDAAAGARTSIFLATAPEAQGITGKYFFEESPKEPNPLAHDKALRKELWDASEKLTGFAYTY